MKCLACSKELSVIKEFGIELEVCNLGCGGIWFDASELEKLDERHEKISQTTLFAGRNQNTVVVDHSKTRICPKCNSVELEKSCHLSDIEIDSCPNCTGIWLDPGEFNFVREGTSNKNHREDVFEKFTKQAENSKHPNRIKAVIELMFK